MNLNSIIFTNNLPTLDLHGLDRDTARVLINDFVNDNVKTKNPNAVIIHGNGSGILKSVTKETLSKNKYVLDYQIHIFNSGCTIVKFDLTK